MGPGEISAIVFGGSVSLLILILPAVQAYRRGYNPFVWGLAGLFAMNPIFVLVVLAMAPHRGRRRLRDRYRAELDEKLEEAGEPVAGAVPLARPVRDRSIGDVATQAPGRIDTRSVGDQVTELPRDRSIGDDQTRM